MIRAYALFALLIVLAACAPAADTTTGTTAVVDFELAGRPLEERWIIAVPNFEVRSGSVKFSGETFTGQDDSFFRELGSGVADVFVTEAFRSQQFRITERAEIDKVISEQNLAITGRVDPSSAAEVGRIIGAELIVLGSLSEFGVTSTGGGGRVLGVFGGSAETVTARVTVDIRFVDAVTAEIITIGTSTSEVSQSNVSVDVFNIIRALQAGRSGTTIIDIAIRNAIRGAINEAAASLPPK
jgi:curli biogenesis system outer membrane secretion channel CsgG